MHRAKPRRPSCRRWQVGFFQELVLFLRKWCRTRPTFQSWPYCCTCGVPIQRVPTRRLPLPRTRTSARTLARPLVRPLARTVVIKRAHVFDIDLVPVPWRTSWLHCLGSLVVSANGREKGYGRKTAAAPTNGSEQARTGRETSVKGREKRVNGREP